MADFNNFGLSSPTPDEPDQQYEAIQTINESSVTVVLTDHKQTEITEVEPLRPKRTSEVLLLSTPGDFAPIQSSPTTKSGSKNLPALLLLMAILRYHALHPSTKVGGGSEKGNPLQHYGFDLSHGFRRSGHEWGRFIFRARPIYRLIFRILFPFTLPIGHRDSKYLARSAAADQCSSAGGRTATG